MSAFMGTVSVISGSIRPITFTVPVWGAKSPETRSLQSAWTISAPPPPLIVPLRSFSRLIVSMRFYDFLIDANKVLAGERDSRKNLSRFRFRYGKRYNEKFGVRSLSDPVRSPCL